MNLMVYIRMLKSYVKYADMVLLDLQKVFDTTDHEILTLASIGGCVAPFIIPQH